MERKIIVSVSGASGAVYAKVLFDKLLHIKQQVAKVGVVLSDNAKEVWKYELGNELYKDYPFDFYNKNDFMAPFASGSAKYDTMTRAADVILKERRKLILVVRDTPYNLIHINNMKTVTEAGGIICPATPSFYSRPQTFEELAATVIDRVIDLCGLENESYRWND